LAKISLFIPEDGSEGVQNAGKSLAFRVTARAGSARAGRGKGRSGPSSRPENSQFVSIRLRNQQRSEKKVKMVINFL
jgi:hypothetical protein